MIVYDYFRALNHQATGEALPVPENSLEMIGMMTVKQVADLTGVSVRTLQYYDEIGLLKPTEVTDSGYRLYDEEALGSLQQILFFKELDFPLKDIREIMENPGYDKIEAFKKQEKLIRVKRDRLNRLLELLEKLERGETCMSFEEFDMSEYIQVLEKFKAENMDEVIKHWGSVEKFDRLIEVARSDNARVGKMAIRQYGSIEKYTEAMRDNMEHFSEYMEYVQSEEAKKCAEKNKELSERLTSDLTKDYRSREIQDIVGELIRLGEESPLGQNNGEGYWDMIIDWCFHNESYRKAGDKIRGEGATEFTGHALQYYFETHYQKNNAEEKEKQ